MKLSVLNYNDYRSYLKDQLRLMRQRNAKFSMGAWSKRLELKTSSGLIMVLNGQRNPGPNLTEKIVQDLRLIGREATFFRELISLEKIKNDESLQTLTMKRLAELHPQKMFRTLDFETYKTISNWYGYAIRELTDLSDFQEDPVWIQKRLKFPVSLREISDTLRVLQEIELVKRDANGKIRYNYPISTTFDIPDEALKQHHHEMLRLAQESLRSTDVENREISGITFTMHKQDLPRAKELIRQVLWDLGQLGKNGGDEVFALETALFPLTQNLKGPKQ